MNTKKIPEDLWTLERTRNILTVDLSYYIHGLLGLDIFSPIEEHEYYQHGHTVPYAGEINKVNMRYLTTPPRGFPIRSLQVAYMLAVNAYRDHNWYGTHDDSESRLPKRLLNARGEALHAEGRLYELTDELTLEMHDLSRGNYTNMSRCMLVGTKLKLSIGCDYRVYKWTQDNEQ